MYVMVSDPIKEYIDLSLKTCNDTNESLIEKYRKGNISAKEQLIAKNYGMVRTLAAGFALRDNTGVDFDDLIQEGFMGLLEAVDRYDPDYEQASNFIAYAVHWIRQQMTRYLKSKSKAIRIPEYQYAAYKRLLKAQEGIEATQMRAASLKDISKAMGISTDEVLKLRRAFKEMESTDKPLGEDETTTVGDIIKDTSNPYQRIDRECFVDWLQSEFEFAFKTYLTLRESEILKLRYGLDDREPMPIIEIAQLFSVTHQMIHSIISQSLSKLRRTHWFIRLKNDLSIDSELALVSKNTYAAVETRVDQAVRRARSLRNDEVPVELRDYIGIKVKDEGQPGDFPSLGIIILASEETVIISWEKGKFTEHDPSILGTLVKVGYKTYSMKGTGAV